MRLSFGWSTKRSSFSRRLSRTSRRNRQAPFYLEGCSEHLGVSYRYALHGISLAEERLGQLLVIRVRGGAKGGGSSEVTVFGKDLVIQYRKAQVNLDGVLKELRLSDGLLIF